jgi:hypothetical protein
MWSFCCAAAVVVALALAGCGGGGSDEAGSPAAGDTETATTTVEETATGDTTSEEATTEEGTTTQAEPAGPRRIRISVRNGKPRGDTGTVRVERGEDLVLIVRADVEDEVHVHGYDLLAPVAPGHASRISFKADQPGTFTIELEGLHLHIAKLRVAG